MPYLMQKKPDGSLVQMWQLAEKPLTIGRSGQADVAIADREMSKRHFTIEPKSGSYFIRDLKSTNFTFVNNQQITEVELHVGDRIRAGQTLFIFDRGFGTMIGDLAEGKAPTAQTQSSDTRESH